MKIPDRDLNMMLSEKLTVIPKMPVSFVIPVASGSQTDVK